MLDPTGLYVGLAFLAGIFTGVVLCSALVKHANRTLDEAISRLNRAKQKHEQATAFYQDSMRASEKIRDMLRRLDGGRSCPTP